MYNTISLQYSTQDNVLRVYTISFFWIYITDSLKKTTTRPSILDPVQLLTPKCIALLCLVSLLLLVRKMVLKIDKLRMQHTQRSQLKKKNHFVKSNLVSINIQKNKSQMLNNLTYKYLFSARHVFFCENCQTSIIPN